jgi:immune inhibitor A
VNRRVTGVFGGAAAFALVAAVVPGSATAAPPVGTETSKQAAHKLDDRRDPLEARRRALQKRATDLVVSGQAKIVNRGGSAVVKVSKQDWVQYGVTDTAQILSFLVDFGDKADARFPMAPAAGPVHNNIPAPDRSEDNSTYWRSSFDRQHYLDMFFNGMPDQGGESFNGVYQEMSSGRFDVEGDVSDWVTVPNSEASYGQTESNVDMTRFIGDSAQAWYADQQAKGKSEAEIAAYLKSFDVWDRFDHDGDGVFNEPDGYVDHFQAIHAGTGEEAGAPEWAIWSHRWAANPSGRQGPEGAKFGGVQIGNTGLWIRDYTTEPENGGLGVFAHEFGHDLGLPDYYDTRGGENSSTFWTLMSSGSWLNHGGDAIGTTPNHMGPTEKLQLGWLDYTEVAAGKTGTVDLGPSFHATTKPQAVLVHLPAGKSATNVGPAFSGRKYLYSGTGDNRTATVTSPEFTVPQAGKLTAKVNYAIEDDWDYAYAEISTDGGNAFTPLATNRSTTKNPNNQNDGQGITGCSGERDAQGNCAGGWVDLSADLSAYAGQKAKVRFRMFNDAGYHEVGFKVDDIAVGSALSTDVEDDAAGWTRDGFLVVTDGSYDTEYTRYYLAENRQYAGYDRTLAEGPYNFGWNVTAPDKVERFPFQNGLLVWYANSLYSDNNTSQHPGGGEALPVDARAAALKWSDGTVARNRIQAFDATFGLSKTDPLSLHREVALKEGGSKMTTLNVGKQPAEPVFDDTDPNRYYDAVNNPGGSVVVAGTGTTIRVLKSNDRKGEMTVKVN